MSFSFGFSGDDIEPDTSSPSSTTTPAPPPAASAFPVQGRPQLPPTCHVLSALLATLPSKIAYDCLDIPLDGPRNGHVVRLYRRELWDVRVQLMAEDDGDDGDKGGGGDCEGLGASDVKTGVYEGGFKSWESSVDLVKTLFEKDLIADSDAGLKVLELGCGTALPSLAIYQRALSRAPGTRGPLTLVLADYNPSVLHLVTLPNLILTWALHHRDRSEIETPAFAEAFSIEGELILLPAVVSAFVTSLEQDQIDLRFYSGGWSPEFARMVRAGLDTGGDGGDDGGGDGGRRRGILILGAETIYSPFALRAFTDTVFDILRAEQQQQQQQQGHGQIEDRDQNQPNTAACIVAAKKLYFGVGGSLDDFVDLVRSMGARVEGLREEAVGVRRGVVKMELEG